MITHPCKFCPTNHQLVYQRGPDNSLQMSYYCPHVLKRFYVPKIPGLAIPTILTRKETLKAQQAA